MVSIISYICIAMPLPPLPDFVPVTKVALVFRQPMIPEGYGKIERDESEVTFQKLEKIAEILELKDIINFDV